jgi:23S rRNA pseudouridine1911/1915/1917 synthase
MTSRTLPLPDDALPDRLDRVLAAAWGDFSRSRLQALIRAGHVEVDGALATDPSAKVMAGSTIVLAEPEPVPAEPQGETIPLAVVYEDDSVIVIDKPAGLVVHPAAGHESGTLVNALIAHCGDSLSGIGGVRRPGIVHRIDKDTSGLLVVAKTDRAHQSLAAQFADHGRTGPLERAYLAFLWGAPDPARGVIEAAIARHNSSRERMAVSQAERARHAITRYAVEERYPADAEPVASLVRCTLETGRTHQIRVHMAHLRHPLVGDALYGAGFRTKAARLPDAARAIVDGLGRQALHATLLQFEHPETREVLRFESPLPPDLAALRDALAEA